MSTRPQLQEEITELAFQVARQMRRRMDDHLPDKASLYQIHALMAVSQGADTMGALAKEMDVALPTATSLVDRLVKSGWLERRSDADDRRITRLKLTPAGRQTCVDMRKRKAKAFRLMLEVMPEDDLAALHRILKNLHHNL